MTYLGGFMNHYQHIRERLREIRMCHRYTQSFVAKSLNITQQTYSSYETGKSTPSSDILLELSNLYRISIDTLIGNISFSGIPLNSISLLNNNINETINSQEFLKRFLSLPDYEKQIILDFVNLLYHKNKLLSPK